MTGTITNYSTVVDLTSAAFPGLKPQPPTSFPIRSPLISNALPSIRICFYSFNQSPFQKCLIVPFVRMFTTPFRVIVVTYHMCLYNVISHSYYLLLPYITLIRVPVLPTFCSALDAYHVNDIHLHFIRKTRKTLFKKNKN